MKWAEADMLPDVEFDKEIITQKMSNKVKICYYCSTTPAVGELSGTPICNDCCKNIERGK